MKSNSNNNNINNNNNNNNNNSINTNNNTTSNKKAKKDTNTTTTTTTTTNNIHIKNEIKTLQQYILNCPHVSSTSIAVETCMKALSNELKRIERDEKLQFKFSQENTSSHGQKKNVNTMRNKYDDDDLDDDVVCVEMNPSTEYVSSSNQHRNQNASSNTNDEEIDMHLTEWQDVGVSVTTDKDNYTSSSKDGLLESPSVLGTSLAQCAIEDMASANILVSTPIAALALALHSTLRSDIVGFKCTGAVPEEVESVFSSDNNNNIKKKKKKNGFAPPVRELPKGKFLPDGWDKYALKKNKYNDNKMEDERNLQEEVCNKVTLRYRKNKIGATILRVTEVREDNTLMANICFGPEGGEPWMMNVPLNRHINIDGLNAALEKCNKVQPALHYKALPLLLSDFCKNCDLGIEKEDLKSSNNIGLRIGSTTIPSNNNNNHMNTFNQSSPYVGKPTIEDDLLGGGLQTVRPGGDFAGDLLPSGIPTPGFADPRLGMGGGHSGNLMGMNHPYFQGDFDDNNIHGSFPGLGGLGMQPRFDPYYPPGVSGRGGRGRFGPGRGRGRGGTGRGRGGRGTDFSGDPNPDHERPPNTFNNDMFM